MWRFGRRKQAKIACSLSQNIMCIVDTEVGADYFKSELLASHGYFVNFGTIHEYDACFGLFPKNMWTSL